VLAGAGIVVAHPTPVDQNHDGINQTALDDNYSGLVPGTLMVIAGAILIAAGASATEPVPAPTFAYAPPPPPPSYAFAPPSAAVQLPADTMLPELPATPEVLRLGQQIRSAVQLGHCDAAWTMWRALAQRDASYAVALHAGPVMAACPVDEGAQ
jgi:hypothetical protein